jgi:riboflavin synthase alpha subunit
MALATSSMLVVCLTIFESSKNNFYSFLIATTKKRENLGLDQDYVVIMHAALNYIGKSLA